MAKRPNKRRRDAARKTDKRPPTRADAAHKPSDLPTTMFCAAGLAVLSFVAFAPALRNGFVNWDDGPYIVINRLLDDFDGLKKIWMEPEESPIYYPLVFTSFWIERQIGVHEYNKGLEIDGVWGNHAINMLIHALGGILLWRCLVRLRMPAGWAWLAAAVWMVHPLQVESVAWAAERKNTMSGLFYFASALMYLRADGRMRSLSYFAALFLFICMMLSKTAFVALPVTLLMLEWLQGRSIGRAALLRVAPFFVLGVLLAMIMVTGEQTVVIVETLTARLMIAGQAFWFYLYKLFWPLGAITIYPRWDTAVTALKMVPLAAAVTAGIFWLTAAIRRPPKSSLTRAVVLIAAAQYVVTVGPALGIIAWPHMDRSFVANHFVYIPLVGPIVLIVLGARRLAQRAGPRPRAARIAHVSLALVLALLGAYSFKRTLAWRNNQTLIDDILAVNPDCPEAHALWSIELEHTDRDAAVEKMQWVIDHKPRYPRARIELARMLVRYRGELEAAVGHLRAAMEMKPEMDDGHYQLAVLQRKLGRRDEALSDLNRTSERRTNSVVVLNMRARLLLDLRRHEDAFQAAERLIKVIEESDERGKLRLYLGAAHLYRARALRGLGDLAGAVREFEEALVLAEALIKMIEGSRRSRSVRANLAKAYLNRGHAKHGLGDRDGAEREFTRALELNPRLAPDVEEIRTPPTSMPTQPAP